MMREKAVGYHGADHTWPMTAVTWALAEIRAAAPLCRPAPVRLPAGPQTGSASASARAARQLVAVEDQ